jgi:hypothetical protein
MGNKNEKSSLDQEILDKLMEETGLEREVIIAWRFVIIFFKEKYSIIFSFLFKKTIFTGLSIG